MISNVLILAAGKGSRLLPLTAEKPKPLLEVNDKFTILDRLITQCYNFLPTIPISINIGFLAEKILLHIGEKSLQYRPSFLFEKEILGPAETLVQFSKIRNGRTLVIHGDLVLSDEGFCRFVDEIKRTKSQMIVCHYRSRISARSEVKLFKEQNIMQEIIEFNQEEISDNDQSPEIVLTSSGLFVIDLANVVEFKARPEESLSPRLLNFINRETVQVHVWHNWRFAIDSVNALQDARAKIAEEAQN